MKKSTQMRFLEFNPSTQKWRSSKEWQSDIILLKEVSLLRVQSK